MSSATTVRDARAGWRLCDRYGNVLVLPARAAPEADLSLGERFLLTESDLLYWLSDPLERGVVLDVYEALRGASGWSGFGGDIAGIDAQVVRTILRAVDMGELLVLRPPPPRFQARTAKEAPERPRQEPVTEDWVGLRIVDQNGRPVPGVQYRITLASGATIEGEVDSNGKARIEGLSPGPCSIACPDLDGRAWDLDARG
ncbi:carboxypeptidase-like regulatory domain-containing protein [Pendulispora albinea]|uniref:Carboxypeptidase-like regulatory domain-containing protein n=1 Tax=Pendulispora albinea TaxID=2741071 RepID=A0ABZ2MA55_9BACT